MTENIEKFSQDDLELNNGDEWFSLKLANGQKIELNLYRLEEEGELRCTIYPVDEDNIIITDLHKILAEMKEC